MFYLLEKHTLKEKNNTNYYKLIFKFAVFFFFR